MRYSTEPRTWVPHRAPGSTVEIVTRPPTVWRDQPYITYQMSDADSFMLMAHSRYGTATAYWLLADMNPTIACPDDARSGDLVHVPLIQ